MAAEMKINEKFMVIYGNLRSPKAKNDHQSIRGNLC